MAKAGPKAGEAGKQGGGGVVLQLGYQKPCVGAAKMMMLKSWIRQMFGQL